MSIDRICLYERDVKKEGLSFWASGVLDGKDRKVDIIFVQGLGSHPYYTWIGKPPGDDNKPESSSLRLKFANFGLKSKKKNKFDTGLPQFDFVWLRDLLPRHINNARIATYSYKSNWLSKEARVTLSGCGEQLLNILRQNRLGEKSRRRPIVFVGHSLGGIVIKQALVTANHGDHFADIRDSTAAAIFLGTPCQGSSAADLGDRLTRAYGNDQPLLKTLRSRSEELYNLSRNFEAGYGSRLQICCFYEQTESHYGSLPLMTVTQQSSTMVGRRMIYEDSDHSRLNKFWGEEDENFHLFLPELREFVSYAAERRHEKPKGTSRNIHWIVPNSASSIFKGREQILEEIEKILQGWLANTSRTKQCRLVITGMGGQGKSEICLQVANHVQKRFWGVFWVDVSAFNTAESGFLAIAKALEAPAETLAEARQALAQTEAPWLLILDNADDPETDYQDYFPTGRYGMILMTSRVPECSKYATIKFDTLEGLEDTPARDLLLDAARIPESKREEHLQDAASVATLLNSHPLALVQAGAYVAAGHCTFRGYPQVYERNRERLLGFRPKQAKSRYGDVYATFEASAEVLKKSDTKIAKGALEILDVFSMLAASRLPLYLFELAWWGGREISMDQPEDNDIGALSPWHVSQLISPICTQSGEWDDFELVESISLLQSLSLVTEDITDDGVSFSMHPLVHSWTRDRQNQDQQVQSWLTTGSIIALSEDFDYWDPRARQLRPHIHALVALRPPVLFRDAPELMVVQILLRCGNHLDRMRDDTMLSELLDDMMDQMCLHPDIVREDCAELYRLRARNLSRLGRTTESISLLKQMIKIRERMLDEEKPGLIEHQHELALAYRDNGQVAEALSLLQHVVEIRERTLAEGHPDRLASQHELARVYKDNGQVAEALSLLQHVVEIRERTLAEGHSDRLASQQVLACTLWDNNQLDEAVELMEYVVRLSKRALRPGHPKIESREGDLAWMRNRLPPGPLTNSENSRAKSSAQVEEVDTGPGLQR